MKLLMYPMVSSHLMVIRLQLILCGAAEPTILKVAEPTILKGHTETVVSIAWSPDGKTLASGSGDKTLKLWNIASGKEIAIRGQRAIIVGEA
jgi:hypothetical protein